MYKVRKRKEYEDVIRRQRQNIGSWVGDPQSPQKEGNYSEDLLDDFLPLVIIIFQ